jgi:hypothetical protein
MKEINSFSREELDCVCGSRSFKREDEKLKSEFKIKQ